MYYRANESTAIIVMLNLAVLFTPIDTYNIFLYFKIGFHIIYIRSSMPPNVYEVASDSKKHISFKTQLNVSISIKMLSICSVMTYYIAWHFKESTLVYTWCQVLQKLK